MGIAYSAMGAAYSRIWTELCAIESDEVRAQMLETLLLSPDYISEARAAGVYGGVLTWLSAYRHGRHTHFPWKSGHVDSRRPTERGSNAGRANSSIVVSNAQAADYFQQCLTLLGISAEEQLTPERIRAAYKRSSLTAHPDKGGSAEAFAALKAATQYVTQIINRVNPSVQARFNQKVDPTTALKHRDASTVRIDDDPTTEGPPVVLSSKKLNIDTFNKVFEENRLPDEVRDKGYGDWLKSADEPALDNGPVNPKNFESVFRERATRQAPMAALMQYREPSALYSPGGYQLGATADNFTADFGSDTQFTDLKEAYTTGATMYQEVANVKVTAKGSRSMAEIERARTEEMARVDPDESARIAASAAAFEEHERQRRLRVAQQDTEAESWFAQTKRHLLVN